MNETLEKIKAARRKIDPVDHEGKTYYCLGYGNHRPNSLSEVLGVDEESIWCDHDFKFSNDWAGSSHNYLYYMEKSKWEEIFKEEQSDMEKEFLRAASLLGKPVDYKGSTYFFNRVTTYKTFNDDSFVVKEYAKNHDDFVIVSNEYHCAPVALVSELTETTEGGQRIIQKESSVEIGGVSLTTKDVRKIAEMLEIPIDNKG